MKDEGGHQEGILAVKFFHLHSHHMDLRLGSTFPTCWDKVKEEDLYTFLEKSLFLDGTICFFLKDYIAVLLLTFAFHVCTLLIYSLMLSQFFIVQMWFQHSSDWPIVDPLPSYGRGRELPGPRHQSLIHGFNLTDVVVTGYCHCCLSAIFFW